MEYNDGKGHEWRGIVGMRGDGMRVVAFSGSPRKSGNTATLLGKALEGAESAGAEAELFHLYEYAYKGCVSCLACKRADTKHPGRCAVRDELTPLLERALAADVLLVGTPVYLGTETAATRAFTERLIYPCHTYAVTPITASPRSFKTGILYTMGKADTDHRVLGYDKLIERFHYYYDRAFGHCEVFVHDKARLFGDHAKYFCPRIDAKAQAAHYEKTFPLECERAFAFGKALAE